MRTTLIVLVLALTACTDSDETTDAAATAPPTASSAPVAAGPSTTAAATDADLPACDVVEPTATATGWDHPDCRISSAGDPPFTLTVRYGATEASTGETPLTIDVSPGVVGSALRIDEMIGTTFEAPRLDDLDGDGRLELLVPLETGNVNTTYAVWVRAAGTNDLVRAGEVSAFDFAVSQDGYVVALARGSATTYNASFLRVVDGAFAPIATAESALDVGTCTIFDDGGLDAVGLDLESATARFCNDPAVVAGGG